MRDRQIRIASTPHGLTRRAALGRLGAIGLGTLTATACASAPSVLSGALYPDGAVLDEESVDRALSAFVETVVRDAEAAPGVTRVFADPALKFAGVRRAFAADLRRQAFDLTGEERFERLPLEHRTRIISAGLTARGIRSRLYNGAVFLAQIVYFAGLWNDGGECPAIGFEGAYVYRGDATFTWPDPHRFLPAARTADGNPA